MFETASGNWEIVVKVAAALQLNDIISEWFVKKTDKREKKRVKPCISTAEVKRKFLTICSSFHNH